MSSDAASEHRELLVRATRDLESMERRIAEAEQKGDLMQRRLFYGNGEPPLVVQIARLQDAIQAMRHEYTRRIEALESVNKRLVWMVVAAVMSAAMALIFRGGPPG